MGQRDEQREVAEGLWDNHGNAVYRFALRLSGNPTLAEDLTSETILGAMQAIRKGRTDIHRGYLFGITLNKWRKSRRVEAASIDDLVALDAPDRGSLVDLERAFRKLSRAHQEAFVLVRAEGFTSREAAEILGIPQGTVQARVHEATHQMRHLLSEPSPVAPHLMEVKS